MTVTKSFIHTCPDTETRVDKMELVELHCSNCGYKVNLLLGTQDLDQTFSDLNEDFAYYRAYLCPLDKTLHSMNVHDREWNGDCPEHRNVKLQPLQDLPKTCPKCSGPLEVTVKEILKHKKGEYP